MLIIRNHVTINSIAMKSYPTTIEIAYVKECHKQLTSFMKMKRDLLQL